MTEAAVVRVGGADDLMRAANVSRETLGRIERVLGVIGAWRKRMNLIGPREWDEVWHRHVWDSMQLRPLIPAGAHILDLGSGAGFPGLILAAAIEPGSGGRVSLVERVGKKCAVMREAIAAASLPATVVQSRIEAIDIAAVDAVSARALAPLPKLVDLAAPWLEAGADGYFLKGERWQEELTAAADRWTFAHSAVPSRTRAGSVVLKLSEVRRGG